MTADEVNAVRSFLAQADARAATAQQRAARAEAERDQLRALLARVRTSLVETVNDPGVAA